MIPEAWQHSDRCEGSVFWDQVWYWPFLSECLACGMRDCPHGEPLHYHHDGCPACFDYKGIAPLLEVAAKSAWITK